MRAVNIVLLVLTGALAGALLMKVAHRPVRVAVRPVMPPVTVSAQAPDAMPQMAPVQASEPAKGISPSIRRPITGKPAALGRRPVALHPAPLRTAARVAPQTPPIAVPTSPPVLPEQPKETPPARMEPENVTSPPAPIPSAPEPNQATLNAGLLIPVRLLDSLSSERNHAGDVFAATLDRELVANGFVVAERGARVEGRVTAIDRGGRTLSLELISVHTLDNQDVPIQTVRFDKRSEPDRSDAAARIGIGAAIGAVIGGVTAGGKGAAIGAGAGGGIGAGDVALTRKPASLRSETRLTFRMRAPITITERAQE